MRILSLMMQKSLDINYMFDTIEDPHVCESMANTILELMLTREYTRPLIKWLLWRRASASMLNNLAMLRLLEMMDRDMFDILLQSCRRGPVHGFQRMRVLWFA